MEIEIAYNTEHEGIEITFPDKPEEEILDQLRLHKFRWHRRGKYWFAKHTKARQEFAESLSSSEIDSISEAFKSRVLLPRFEASQNNLESKKYSYITIRFKNLSGDTGEESFLVFEPNYGKAKEIADLFGSKRHGESFQSILVYPKNYIRNARTLFGLGRIIRESDLKDKEETPFIPAIQESVEEPEQIIEPLVDSPRQRANQRIEDLIKEKDREGSPYLAEDRELLRSYSGSGGLAREGSYERGVLYEYYTPPELVRYMWGLAHKYGYRGGPVMEPVCGTGNFLAYAPKGTELVGYETNPISARIAEILYPQARIVNRPFESIFFAGTVHLGDNYQSQSYDLVIGNPPYGAFTGRYAGLGEKRHTGAKRYEGYFILRGLDLLKPGGLLIYVIPSSLLASTTDKFKAERLSPRIAEVLDAYRLPVQTFEHTTIGTDILVLKKL